MKYKELFSSINIGGEEIKNRFVIPAMGTNLANPDGTVSDRLIGYWRKRAKGGWGLLTTEIVAVEPRGKAIPNQPALWEDGFIPGFSNLFAAVHEEGAKIAVQLHHAGRQTSKDVMGEQPVGPSAVRCPICHEVPYELSTWEVYWLIKQFGDAAKRAKAAGADSVEVHGAHGYLIAQFMSPDANKRVDEFGGSLENRMRFPLEIIKDIRKKVGGNYPIIFRFSADERVTGGRGVSESRAVAKMAEDAGADCIHISTGVYGSMQYIVAPAELPPGYILQDAEFIKEAVSVPVIGVGRINEPEIANDAVKNNRVDMVALGRPSLADPLLPNKVAGDKTEEISPCIACNQGCIGYIFNPNKLYASCLVNPFCGRENELKIRPAVSPKRVVVVGGGPGGLKAAWVAASRGHSVILFEKEKVLGGQYRIGAIPPAKQDISKALNYYITMGKKYGVDYRTGVEVTPDTVMAEQPGAVIIATGGEPIIPDLNGVDGPRVVTSTDILLGNTNPGPKVLVVGGGLVGCETADLLSEHGHEVTLVEMLPELARDVQESVRFFLFKRLSEKKVQSEVNCKVMEFLEDGAVVEKDGDTYNLTGFNQIVLALGVKPNDNIKLQLERDGRIAKLYTIGDALEPRKAIEAIEEGARVAVEI